MERGGQGEYAKPLSNPLPDRSQHTIAAGNLTAESLEMARMKRRQLFVDNKVQGALVMRSISYWFLCLLTVTLMLL